MYLVLFQEPQSVQPSPHRRKIWFNLFSHLLFSAWEKEKEGEWEEAGEVERSIPERWRRGEEKTSYRAGLIGIWSVKPKPSYSSGWESEQAFNHEAADVGQTKACWCHPVLSLFRACGTWDSPDLSVAQQPDKRYLKSISASFQLLFSLSCFLSKIKWWCDRARCWLRPLGKTRVLCLELGLWEWGHDLTELLRMKLKHITLKWKSSFFSS